MSISEKSQTGFLKLIREMDYHPISPNQILGFTETELLTENFYFPSTVPDDLIKAILDAQSVDREFPDDQK